MSDMKRYSENIGADTIEDSIIKHAYLVKRIASHLMSRLPKSVQLDDLIQVGMMGLFEAAQNYDPLSAANFETYASIRIRGSMLDELRKVSWVPRSVHHNMKQIARAIHAIENRTGQEAQAKDIAQELGVKLEEYWEMVSASYGGELFSLEEVSEENMTMSHTSDEPFEALQKGQLKQRLIEQLDKLPQNELLVIVFYYTEKLKFKEIGEVLGIGEARVCQLHGQALVRLQARLKKEIT